ncbi:uncharacterized protein F4822DRAFT_385149 [Hypoxylon trugodes]|uniref:uncharacterized protein n=1 Tax=Hypoxylon trugodes TaxID=326681 RepID=UPI002191E8A3|nr:uncharacterized protein F4822DRAFT_385149 [Hypoxylon trugodes]KAI1393587.1 hypothetical protein F4822DRAFT_385149 [Hypoxylon trugodes]
MTRKDVRIYCHVALYLYLSHIGPFNLNHPSQDGVAQISNLAFVTLGRLFSPGHSILTTLSNWIASFLSQLIHHSILFPATLPYLFLFPIPVFRLLLIHTPL